MARKWPFRKELHHPNEIFHFAAAIGSTHSLAKQKMIPKTEGELAVLLLGWE